MIEIGVPRDGAVGGDLAAQAVRRHQQRLARRLRHRQMVWVRAVPQQLPQHAPLHRRGRCDPQHAQDRGGDVDDATGGTGDDLLLKGGAPGDEGVVHVVGAGRAMDGRQGRPMGDAPGRALGVGAVPPAKGVHHLGGAAMAAERGALGHRPRHGGAQIVAHQHRAEPRLLL